VSYPVKVFTNWSGDDFSGPYDELTSYVLEVRWSRGFDKELGHNTGGICDIVLLDTDCKFLPDNSSSIYYSKTLLGKEIKVCTDTHNLFYGYINNIIPHPRKDEKICYISAVDGTDRLARQKADTFLGIDIQSGVAITAILDAVGWPAEKRSIDTGVDSIPFWFGFNEKALQLIGDLEDIELSRFWVDGLGYARWEDRHHKLKSPHDAIQATVENKMVDLMPNISLLDLINKTEFTVTPRAEEATESNLFTLGFVPAIEPGQTYSFDICLDKPTLEAYYLVTFNSDPNGSGTDLTSQCDCDITWPEGYGAIRWKVSVTNNASVIAYLTQFEIWGWAIAEQGNVIAESEDSVSQSEYGGIYPYSLSCAWEQILTLAQGKADYLVSKYKDPITNHTMKLININDEIQNIMLSRDISDRIRIINSRTGTNADFHIRHIDHVLTDKFKKHECTWELEPAETEHYWILDDLVYSVLDSTTKLAF
jgi:hypothetical protein